MKCNDNLRSYSRRGPGISRLPVSTVSAVKAILVLALLMVILGSGEFIMVISGFLAARLIRAYGQGSFRP